MKRLTCVLAMALGVVALATIPVLADNEVGMVTGAIAGLAIHIIGHKRKEVGVGKSDCRAAG